ncbi:MAG: nitroreductase [Firmicutes bacterium]|nr:nitroreductase [Bacillota bacterium]
MGKNPPTFVGGAVVNSFQGMVDFGYLFEYIILQLTKEGFGTVWLGATFERKAFNDFLKEGEVIPAVSVVGYTADHKSLVETFTRMGVKANRRKPFSDLFFEKNISTPLNAERMLLNRFSKYLELVRLAPSGTNQQPWRVITHGNLVHFYLKRTPNYAKNLNWDIQAVDLGIAISHFEIGLKEDRIKYAIHLNSKAEVIPGLEYVTTFEVEL